MKQKTGSQILAMQTLSNTESNNKLNYSRDAHSWVLFSIFFSTIKHVFLDGGLRRLARLLVCNFRALEHGYGERESVLQSLRELPIIPLADGRVVALSEEGVFFPVETQIKKSKDLIQTGNFMSVHCNHSLNELINYNIINNIVLAMIFIYSIFFRI